MHGKSAEARTLYRWCGVEKETGKKFDSRERGKRAFFSHILRRDHLYVDESEPRNPGSHVNKYAKITRKFLRKDNFIQVTGMTHVKLLARTSVKTSPWKHATERKLKPIKSFEVQIPQVGMTWKLGELDTSSGAILDT
ncbi:hypothetical protein TNCV_500841 [Trichonephila clavipes]|nr:hypothetical protein TNCV_500841 [Trichonephila clavipes]